MSLSAFSLINLEPFHRLIDAQYSILKYKSVHKSLPCRRIKMDCGIYNKRATRINDITSQRYMFKVYSVYTFDLQIFVHRLKITRKKDSKFI